MTPESRGKARAHLGVAIDYLGAAREMIEAERHSPAVARAITSGINAKDAICLMRTGKTGKSQTHAEAIKELGAAVGPAGKSEVAALKELLSHKNAAQYDAARISSTTSTAAIRRAERLVTAAEFIATEV